MLTKFLLRNFQKWDEFELELDPITVLVGDSDKGKSSVLRGLKWICSNKPSGDAFIRHGTRYCSGSLWVDGYKIKRYKGPKGNRYLLNDKEFKAFGNDVPEAIAQLLNVGDVNFATQHESPFWLSLSAGQVSKELNEIVDLSVIDEVMAKAATEKRKAQAEVELNQKRLVAAEARYAELGWVEQLDQQLQTAEALEATSQQLGQHVRRLGEILESARSTKSRLDRVVGLRQAIQQAIGVLEKAGTLRREAEQLQNGIRKYYSYQEELCRIQKQRCQVEKDLQSVQACPLCNLPMKTVL